MNIAQETPVGAVVAERLGRAEVFDRLGIDYCCHGATPLAEACAGARSISTGSWPRSPRATCERRKRISTASITPR